MSHRRQALSRSFKVVRLFLVSEEQRKAIFWLTSLVLLILAFNGLNVANSFVGRDFMTAVADRRPRQYAIYAGIYFGVFASSAIVAAFNRFSEERLRLLWREWTTRRLVGRYLDHHAYYRLNEVAGLDNPDQRMTDDVKAFTQTALAFFLLSLNATITSISFLGVLWSITPWLVLVAIVYSATGTGLAIYFGRPLVHLNNLQLRKEADLRFSLIQVRESAEPIAIAGAEPAVGERIMRRLSAVVRNNRLIIRVNRNLVMFTGGYNYMIQLIPILIVAPLYIANKIEFGVVTQSAMAFAQVLGALSLIITQFETLSSFAAVSERIDSVVEAIDNAQRRAPKSIVLDCPESCDRLTLKALSLRSPKDDHEFVVDLSLDLAPADRLLVSGPNPQGKRALFLAIAGIWEEGGGRIIRPKRVSFVPRHSLLVHGRFRDQLAVGGPEPVSYDDEEALRVLQDVGLGATLERFGGLDGEHDWPAVLAPGEQVLVAFARLLLAKPQYAFLDHVTDAIPPDHAGPLLAKLVEAKIPYVSFAENHDMLDHHDAVLEIAEDGSHRVVPARDEVRA